MVTLARSHHRKTLFTSTFFRSTDKGDGRTTTASNYDDFFTIDERLFTEDRFARNLSTDGRPNLAQWYTDGRILRANGETLRTRNEALTVFLCILQDCGCSCLHLNVFPCERAGLFFPVKNCKLSRAPTFLHSYMYKRKSMQQIFRIIIESSIRLG